MFNQTLSSGINVSTNVKEATVDTISHHIGNASNVPEEYIDVAKKHVDQTLKKPVDITTELDQARVELLQINVGNITTTTAVAILPNLISNDNSNAGKILWHFSGENTLRTVTLRIGARTWQEEFARLRLPTSSLLLGKNELKPKAHQEIYNKLCDAIKPVYPSETGNIVILQGASGLGKTYCAQHYFYHQAAQKHQMIAWLTGSSEEAFLQGWSALAQQLRVIDTESSSLNDDDIIKHWCEKKLGQWLFIVDEVGVDAEWLAKRLPQKGGHTIITTHFPYYPLSQKQIVLSFSPLSTEDSHTLLTAYVGSHWQAIGHSEEKEALDYFSVVLGGFPLALTQIALLAHKKVISFERLATQFKQPQLQAYLLNDAVYDQLKNRTFISSVQKGWQHLLAYFCNRYPQLRQEQHEQHIRQFIDFLDEQTSDSEFNRILANESLQEYWEAIALSCGLDINVEEIIHWLACLPLHYEKDKPQWKISLASISALIVVSDKRPLLSFPVQALLSPENNPSSMSVAVSTTLSSNEVEILPKLPESMRISMHLNDSQIKHIEATIATIGKPSEFTAWQLPSVNPYFIPRPKLTEELMQKLPIREKGEDSAQLLLTAATGIGGVGKTELARHYITSNELSGYYQRRFWIMATTDSMLRLEFQQLAIYLRLIDGEKYIDDNELIMRVHKWLSIHSGWIMILDNADNYNEIERWIPREGGAVLITTREPHPGTLSQEQIVTVPLLEIGEAVEWLYKLSSRNPESETNSAAELVESLGCLPLAIAQAAAYLREQPTVSIADYRVHFIELLSDTTLAEYSNTQQIEKNSDAYSRLVISSTWNLSLQAIETYTKSLNIPNISETILNSCAYLSSKNIPITLLEYWLNNLTSTELSLIGYILDEYMGQLMRYSLVERNDSTNTISIHRLVQDVLRYQHTTENQLLFLTNMCSVIDQCIMINDGLDVSLDRLLLPHADTLNQHSYPVCDILKTDSSENIEKIWNILPKALGNLCVTLGLEKKGVDFYERVLSIAILHYGENHVETSSVQQKLAILADRSGTYDKAKALYQKVLVTRIAYYKTEAHMHVAEAQENLANVLERIGDYYEAKALHQNVLNTYIAHYQTEKHIQIARIQQNLANVLKHLGEYKQAEMLYKKSLETKISYFQTASHIDIAETQQGFASVLEELGDYSQALDLHRKAVQTFIAHYQTDDHIRVAGAQQNLCGILLKLGEHEQTKVLYEKILTIKIKYYQTEDHILVAEAQQNLALALESLKDYKQAKNLYQKALATKIKFYKTESHINVANTQQNLAGTLCYLGEYVEAEALYRQALKTKQIHYQTETHVKVAESQQNLALVLAKLGDYSQAIALMDQALKTKITHYKTSAHLSVATTQKNLAILFTDVGYLPWALHLFQECAIIFQNQPGGEQHLVDCQQKIEIIKMALQANKNAHYALTSSQYEEAALFYEGLIKLCSACQSYYHNAANVYHLLGIQKNNSLYFSKADHYFNHALILNNCVNTQVEYTNFLRARGKHTKALTILNNLLVLNDEDDTGGLSYCLGEAITLPHDLAKKVRVNGDLIIKNPIFFAHYLKIICLLEQHVIEPIMISESLIAFANFVDSFRNIHPEDFLPIYDWLLGNAHELLERQQSAATCIQRFFREHITRQNANQNEARLHP